MSLATANKRARAAVTEKEAVQEVVHVTTKYGPLVVTFGGEREFEEHDFEHGRRKVTVRICDVQTPGDTALMVNGVAYKVRASMIYGPHGVWQGRDKEPLTVTEWHFRGGEYPYITREKHFGQFSTWTGEPTDKARSAIQDAIMAAANDSAREFPEAVTEGLRVWLNLSAEQEEVEAQAKREEADECDTKARALRARAAAL